MKLKLYNLIKNYEKISSITNSKYLILNNIVPRNQINKLIILQTLNRSKLKLLNHMVYIVKLKNSSICLGTFTTKKNYVTQCDDIIKFKKSTIADVYSSSLHSDVFYVENINNHLWKDLILKTPKVPIEMTNKSFICHFHEMKEKFNIINVNTNKIETNKTIINEFLSITTENMEIFNNIIN